VVVLVVGATTVFAELQSALDRIWHVPERAEAERGVGHPARAGAVVRA
jgi:membrane protein